MIRFKKNKDYMRLWGSSEENDQVTSLKIAVIGKYLQKIDVIKISNSQIINTKTKGISIWKIKAKRVTQNHEKLTGK
jgi:hypothetical protein